jgi:hypothetical protein
MFYYSTFIWSSTCFGRHTAHHQEPKTALAASSFSYVKGCWMCQARQRPPSTRPTTFHVKKTRGCQCSYRLLMIGCVSPETCGALCKYEKKYFDTLLHFVGFSLWIILWCTDPRTPMLLHYLHNVSSQRSPFWLYEWMSDSHSSCHDCDRLYWEICSEAKEIVFVIENVFSVRYELGVEETVWYVGCNT